MATATAPATRTGTPRTKTPRPARTSARSPATSAAVRNAAERRLTDDRIKAGLAPAEVERLAAEGILATEDV